MVKLLNYRIEQEELRSRLYWAMGQWLDFVGYTGAAKLWKKYSGEEASHSVWAYEFLQDLDILPTTPALVAPPQIFDSLGDVILKTVLHEEEVTRQCNELAKACLEEGDLLTAQLGFKYQKEQQEELGKAYMLKDRLELFGTDPVSLRMFDEELGDMAG